MYGSGRAIGACWYAVNIAYGVVHEFTARISLEPGRFPEAARHFAESVKLTTRPDKLLETLAEKLPKECMTLIYGEIAAMTVSSKAQEVPKKKKRALESA